MDQPLDLNFKPSAPMASIIDAYNSMATKQQALKQSQAELDNQNINRVASVFQGAAEMTSNLVQNAEQRQRRDALMNWLSIGGDTVQQPDYSKRTQQPSPAFPVAPGISTDESGNMTADNVQIPMAQPMADSFQTVVPTTPVQRSAMPDYQAKLRSYALALDPKDTVKQLAKSIFTDPNSAASFHNKADPFNMINTKTGQVVAAYFDPIKKAYYTSGSDTPLGPEWTKEYAPTIVKGPQGQPQVAPKTPGVSATDVPQPDNIPGGANDPKNALLTLRNTAPIVADEVEKLQDVASVDHNEDLKSSVDAVSAAQTAKAILKDKNASQVGLQALPIQFARMSGVTQRLNQTELDMYQKPLALIDKVVNHGYQLVAGDLSPTMRGDLIRLSNVFEGRAKAAGQKQIDYAKTRAAQTAGGYWNKGLADTFQNMDQLVVSRKNVLDAIDASKSEDDEEGDGKPSSASNDKSFDLGGGFSYSVK